MEVDSVQTETLCPPGDFLPSNKKIEYSKLSENVESFQPNLLPNLADSGIFRKNKLSSEWLFENFKFNRLFMKYEHNDACCDFIEIIYNRGNTDSICGQLYPAFFDQTG